MKSQQGIIKPLFLIILFLALVGVVFFFVDDFEIDSFSNSSSCGDQTEFFTHLPIALEDFHALIPLGTLSPSAHTFPTDHIYFQRSAPNGEQGLTPKPVNVYMPGDATVNEIRAFNSHWGDGRIVNDYSIYFSPCKEFEAYYIHIQTLSTVLSEALKNTKSRCDEYETGGNTYESCSYNLDIEMKSGDVVGQVGTTDFWFSFDLGALDSRTPELSYANPSRWYKRIRHVVCPVDYFEPLLKDKLETKFGNGTKDYFQKRVIKPLCGEVAQDIPSSAQGVWFLKGTRKTYPEDKHLSLVHDNIDPTLGVFSVGTSIADNGLESGLYYFKPQSSGNINRDFDEVKEGELYCYKDFMDRFSGDVLNLSIYLQISESRELSIEGRSTNSCDGMNKGFNLPEIFSR